jgi:aldehyde dehydrogenase (NAD+)
MPYAEQTLRSGSWQFSDIQSVKSEIFPILELADANLGGFNGEWFGAGPLIEKRSPIDGSFLGTVAQVSAEELERILKTSTHAFEQWREVPAPKRGELIRRLGERLRILKKPLGMLVSLEAGKIIPEGEGEVQEMIDICDFANGLSRQLYGLTIASERPKHRMLEQWHPLGVVGIISAFNFPVAVWAWNSALATVCGCPSVWKPSEKTPLTAIACIKIAEKICREMNVDPAILSLAVGGREIGERLASDRRVPLISATGSTRMGRSVAQTASARLGKTLLELGGNNALIVTESADLELARRAVLFGAVGTAGQRCTSTRRLIVQESIKDTFVAALIAAYRQVPIGDPLQPETLMGPLIDTGAVKQMLESLEEIRAAGGKVLYGGDVLDLPGGLYVTPCIAEARNEWPAVQRETFAPILYVLPFKLFSEAIAIHNDVLQGLSSAIFSRNILETEQFLSCVGSDCGIANVNLGTSGAEIGGAFGGEKETGGGRESGSDSWKSYMRRQTATINYGTELPLAQGIRFG